RALSEHKTLSVSWSHYQILKDGRNLSRKSLCAKLLCRLEQATGEEEQKHYNALIGLLFE
ncbi:hypothetical protein MZH03_29050, partial [Escherichia coli]|nr:hypothetical protein [Escherichia coli]